MDKTAAYKIAETYINSIGTKYTIIRAYLFGSYAKGNFNDDSDIDIAVVVDNVEDIIDTQIEMMKLRRKVDLRIEPHPFNKADFNSNNPLANEVIRHGIAIGK
ncbi:MAG TPA: nucleotidyltransferase domain-containing protein [Prolixibacteraceae bacterium]|nr:nucleotidyltransferase domain-containing protein [Prolixibacteraceae bacterium]HPS11775.1 nucleotidyltransferase domain-containing protein [Prolixibacteraceae bacterium]